MNKNILINEELEIICTGQGESVNKSVEDALNNMRSQIVQQISQPIITLTTERIELVERNDDVKKEAFLYFFSKRERKTINLKLRCFISVSYLDLERG